MSRQPTEIELRLLKRIGEVARERDAAEAEAERWYRHFCEIRAAKRRLGRKYGAIMARKPGARWRRTKKRVRRSVTKVTDKLAVRGYHAWR
jgi:hypothetical protein